MSGIAFGSSTRTAAGLDEALRVVREKADEVRFGTITLVIHEGKLTQMEITEKRRFAP